MRKPIMAVLLLGLATPALAAHAPKADPARNEPLGEADIALSRAIEIGDDDAARAALAAHAAPNRRLAFGATPLMQAVDRQDAPLVGLLLAAGADANLADEEGLSALTLACQLGSEAVLDRLLSAPHIDLRTALPDGASALHICARYAPAPVVARLLAAKLPVDTPDSRGETPLMWAAASGKTESMALLLKAGAKINAATQAGFTPLFFAIKSGVPEASAALLAAGADADHRGPKNTSALQLALYQQNWAAAAQLAQRLPDHSPLLAEKDDQGLPPLNAAAIGGDLALVRLLLAKGAQVNGLSGPSSITWVTEANFGVAPPAVPPTPPLLLAAQHGHAEVMKVLIDHGADPTFTATNGNNIVISAAQGGHADALALAIAVGPDVNLADARGTTALHVLAGSGYSPELAPMLAMLRAHGARADLADKKGHTPAMVADGTLKEVKAAFNAAFPPSPAKPT
ncbi:ankyrin repeat domain-containing protein [Novosphingobium terrae]|uniref:ankyrin repeat domain-containing protein n=1 Tax=Novosphingobium terrae TaxID=2726189 RepID=UPI001F12DB4F|nr:ankyrin repeat domain-containing protein [Novosphingobium terrae]